MTIQFLLKNMLLLAGVVSIFMLTKKCCAKQKKSHQKIPVEILFSNPVKASPLISPDGSKIAFLAPIDDVLNIWICDTENPENTCPLTTQKVRDIRSFVFARDNQHILFFQDSHGDENFHIFRLNIETGEQKDLTPFDGVRASLLDLHRDYPTTALITLNKEDLRFFDVCRLDILTGELTLDTKNPGTIDGWTTDNNFQVRAATRVNDDASQSLLYRETVDDEWQELLTWEWQDTHSSGCVGFSHDGKSLYLIDTQDRNTAALVSYSIQDKTKTIIAQDDEYDIGGALQDDDANLCFIHTERERMHWQGCNEFYRNLLKKMQALDTGDLSIASSSKEQDPNDRKWIIGFSHDTGTATHYLFDAKTGKARFLFSLKPQLDCYTFFPMQPVSFTARDGLKLHGYLTLPVHKEAQNLPLVLYVHGGPWTRDGWGFSPVAQLFANRGYACLQINYRGSTGYGKDLINAGNKEWAGKMHTDLLDGIDWLTEQGIVDPEKVAIFGGSYGGYAALVGATFTPDVFCCAIDWVGPSNLVTLMQSIPPYWALGMKSFNLRVGNLEIEKEFLESRSPLFKVDQIKIPLMIIQGANDPRVKQAESDQIVAVMREKGLPVEYLLIGNEGHGCVRQDNRIDMFKAIDGFLEQHLC